MNPEWGRNRWRERGCGKDRCLFATMILSIPQLNKQHVHKGKVPRKSECFQSFQFHFLCLLSLPGGPGIFGVYSIKANVLQRGFDFCFAEDRFFFLAFWKFRNLRYLWDPGKGRPRFRRKGNDKFWSVSVRYSIKHAKTTDVIYPTMMTY